MIFRGLLLIPLLVEVTNSLVAFSPRSNHDFLAKVPSLDFFKVVEAPTERGATVIEAPVSQEGVKLYIAIDSDSFDGKVRPGNGGIRLLSYQSAKDAIDDAVRLAKGMTRKHDMFRTGFSGAKVVVNSEDKDLTQIERKELMEDAAQALKALEGTMYTGEEYMAFLYFSLIRVFVLIVECCMLYVVCCIVYWGEICFRSTLHKYKK